MEVEEQSDWVVGQDKGNASPYRADAGLYPSPYDFSARQSDAYASPHGAFRTSQYRATLGKFLHWAWPAILTLATLAMSGILLGFIGRVLQLRIMLTDSSAPAGVYRQVNIPAGRGALVAACLPAAIARLGVARGYLRRGDCPAQAEPVAKVIGAVSGDVIDIEPERVAANGVQFANSRTVARDSMGHPLSHVPWGRRRVAEGEVWLFGFNNARSWDARYFGPIPSSDIRGVLKPVRIW